MLCSECGKIVEARRDDSFEEIEVRNRVIKASVTTFTCPECGEEIYDRDNEIKNDISVYDAYKKEMKLLTVFEIKRIRGKYGLSADNFSLLLGFGQKTVFRYEQGSIQDFAHDNLIRQMDNESNFCSLWELRSEVLKKYMNNKIMNVLNKMNETQIDCFSMYRSMGYGMAFDAKSVEYTPKTNMSC